MGSKKQIQVGIVIMRDPKTGAFLRETAKPIMVDETPELIENRSNMCTDAAKFLAEKFRQYKEQTNGL